MRLRPANYPGNNEMAVASLLPKDHPKSTEHKISNYERLLARKQLMVKSTISGDSSKQERNADALLGSLDEDYFFYHTFRHNEHDLNQFTKLGKTRLFEQVGSEEQESLQLMAESINNLVEESCLAAESGKFTVALKKAEGAHTAYECLKGSMMQAQSRLNLSATSAVRTNQSQTEGQNAFQQPITSGVNLFECSVMVKSNLALQFKNTNQLDKSLELYTQLCKLASGTSDSNATIFSDAVSNQQQRSRFLLHRFGLNIGNVLFEKREYQRALKYYRLTLDRLSSPENQNLKIKLMNNIAVALLCLKANPTAQAAPVTGDAITALNLTLADNLVQRKTAHMNQGPRAELSTNGNSTSTTADDQELDVCICNHHRIGLNLMISYYEREELSSMLATFEALVKVETYSHYKRVHDFDRLQRSTSTGDGQHCDDQKNRQVTFGERVDAANKSTYLPFGNREFNSQTLGTTSQPSRLFGDKTIQPTDEPLVSSTSEISKVTLPSSAGLDVKTQSNRAGTPLRHSSDKFHEQRLFDARKSIEPMTEVIRGCETSFLQQEMNILNVDKLERLIFEKESEIFHCLITACNLMLDLDSRLHLVIQTNVHRRGRATIEKASQSKTSALGICMNLLAGSKAYNSLAYALKTNNVVQMLNEPDKLDEAIGMLAIISEQQGAGTTLNKTGQLTQLTTSPESSRELSSSIGGSNNGLDKPQVTHDQPSASFYRSPVIATNLSFVLMLNGGMKEAIRMLEGALKWDKFNVHCWVNLANCHFFLDNLELAGQCYEMALSINPNSLIASYNLMLTMRKLGRHFDMVHSPTKNFLQMSLNQLGLLSQNRMLLQPIQLSRIYSKSGMHRESFDIIYDIVTRCKHESPELYLALHEASRETSLQQISLLDILNTGYQFHSYYIPLLEALVALNIEKYDYETAARLILECAKNRRDQAKWLKILAECYKRSSDYNRAIDIYKIAVDLFPLDTSCIKALAKLSDELGLDSEKEECQAKLDRLKERLLGQ